MNASDNDYRVGGPEVDSGCVTGKCLHQLSQESVKLLCCFVEACPRFMTDVLLNVLLDVSSNALGVAMIINDVPIIACCAVVSRRRCW